LPGVFITAKARRSCGSHSDGYIEFSLLGYNAVQSAENQPMLPSSGSKTKLRKKTFMKQADHGDLLLGSFDPEDGSDVFLPNVGCYIASYPT
jgi:hypothetical protein